MSYLGEVALTRRTYPSGAWDATTGTYLRGSPTTTTIRGTWRPAPIATLQILPEGERVRDPHVLYTTTALQPAVQGGATADEVSADGSTWYKVTDYGIHDLSLPGSPLAHRKFVCLRVREAS